MVGVALVAAAMIGGRGRCARRERSITRGTRRPDRLFLLLLVVGRSPAGSSRRRRALDPDRAARGARHPHARVERDAARVAGALLASAASWRPPPAISGALPLLVAGIALPGRAA